MKIDAPRRKVLREQNLQDSVFRLSLHNALDSFPMHCAALTQLHLYAPIRPVNMTPAIL